MCPKKKKVVFRSLLKCCSHTKDNYWKGLFEDLACDKHVTGIRILKKGNMRFSTNYPCDSFSIFQDPKKLHDLVCEQLLRTDFPRDERLVFVILASKELGRMCETQWSQIRKKSTREMLLQMYVIRMWHKYRLSIDQVRKLLFVIHIAMVNKIIIYKNSEIQEIRGISFSMGKVTFRRHMFSFHLPSQTISLPKKKYMFHTWNKYLKNMKKKM